MAIKRSFNATIASSEKIARVWAESPDFSLGEITLQILQAKTEAARQKRDRIENLKSQLMALSNELGDQLEELANINTRALSGYRATYGPNSSKYEQAGGTRTDERKRTPKKPKSDK
ncbi:MAG: hypothetical protein DMF68_00200 [Acidobacteria bacterium]|nr:MAG: hypothetical protein DMF68_00200 [Acidobacteriota bacterium]